MSVRNFLEDEDYESADDSGSVPDFLSDEDYDSDPIELEDGEYYGGSFSDGVEASGLGDGSPGGGESFGSYEDDEDELFDGEDLLSPEEGGGDFSPILGSRGGERSPASSANYGISGIAPRPSERDAASTPRQSQSVDSGSTPTAPAGSRLDPRARATGGQPVETTVVTPADGPARGRTASPITTPSDYSGNGSTTDGDERGSDTTGGGRRPSTSVGSSLPSSTVPNFLSDEDEDEAPRSGGQVASTPSTPSTAVRSDGATAGSVAPQRERRDLSRRPRQTTGEVPDRAGSTPSSTAGGATEPAPRNGSTAPRFSPDATSPSDSASGGRATPPLSTVRVPDGTAPSTPSFDGRAKPKPLTEEEIEALKSPSATAVNRELRFTALKQKETTVRRVGEDGLTPSERNRASARELPSNVRTPSNGKLSQEELLFYANLGANRSGDFGGKSKKDLFLPPLLGETVEQKQEREARINRALAGGSLARGSRTRLTEKDYRVLRFIALFKFVSERQIAKLLSVTEHSAYKRLNGLRKHGLTKGFKTLGVRGSVWVLTETGMDLSGYELPRGSEAALTLSMVSHQFTVNHVAAYLWSGGANVLREKNFPQRNLPTGSGEFEFGERLISELQIQSAFGKLRGTTKADAYVPQIKRQIANLFDSWKRAGGPGYGPSPELQPGNEHMWTLYPPVSNRLNYHVPDLVVARQRGADGKPQSIAVEVELRTKADDTSYERTLDAYRADDQIYRKVVWVCRLKGTAEKLTRIAKRNGLADQGRIAIVPIYLEDGSRFTGKDTWSL